MRLAAALAKLGEEDPVTRHPALGESGELRLLGQGEMHLRVSLERLANRFGVEVERRQPLIGYRETIRSKVAVRGRHKKQTGGHGQFGDVALEVEPLPRGDGVRVRGSHHGRRGAAPIHLVRGAWRARGAERGPLGFPVVDVRVSLTDGSYHTVNSSDMAFRAAARLAMSEALPKAHPVLLEPIHLVEIAIPSEAISKASAIVSGRRGQILGYDGRPGWDNWDVLKALMPESEIADLIVELRSATSGVGTYSARWTISPS